MAEMSGLPAPIKARIEVSVSGCWEWSGKVNKATGYGVRNDVLAHRLVYQQLVGPIPDGMELDHLCHSRDLSCRDGAECRHRRCVNPDHLEPVTHAENARRSSAGEVNRARLLAKTHCARNHEWTPENTKQTARQRKCRQCIREDSAAARERRKVAA